MTNNLLNKLVGMYGPPDSPDVQLMLSEVAKMLSRYDDSVFERALPKIMQKTSGFPRTKLIFEACKEAHGEMFPDRTPETFKSDDDWSDFSKLKANKLIRTDLGRKAADEGWVACLWDFCRKTHRLPTPHEQITIINQAKAVDDEIDRCFATSVENTGFGKVAYQFKDGILGRRAQLAAIAKETA